MKNYCHICGAKYEQGKTQPWKCTGCSNLSYQNAIPTSDILLFNDNGHVLIAERGIEPSKGKYDFPGGFVDLGESFEEAMEREAFEELGLMPKDYSEPVYVGSQAGTYEFSKEEMAVLSVTFAAKLLADKHVEAKDDVASIKFVSLDQLDSIDFSHSSLPEVIRKAHLLIFG